MLHKPRRKAMAALVGTAAIGISTLATGSASSHGYTDSPISRQKLCANGTVSNCGAIQYEPQSVEGPKGFPAAGPADGRICAGGNQGFSQLDGAKAPNGQEWPATSLTSGANHTFRWKFTAAHATTDFKYFVTKNGWDPSKPITRAQLDPAPFLTVDYKGQRPPFTLEHAGKLPAGKSGRHVILAVWTVHDTPNAFYACSDVKF